MSHTILSLVTVLLLFSRSAQEASDGAPAELPHVVVLATGGTIAGAAAEDGSPGYDAGALGIDILLQAVPQAHELARLSGLQVASIGSQDMSDEVWLKLAREVDRQLADDDVAGVVITHGTDTMEETAFFLNLVVKSDKPVVLTGAMRPATALSPDGPLNLYNAVALAASEQARGHGVLVVANDLIHAAREVTKRNTLFVQAFESPNRGPVGGMHFGELRLFREPQRKHTQQSEFTLGDREELPRVDIIYAHANMHGDLIDAAVSLGAKGIVLAGVGNGNSSQAALEALARARAAGVVVVRSSRSSSGTVIRNYEVDDDANGFVVSDGLGAAKARVLLQLALTTTDDPEQIQQYFWSY